MRTLLQAWFLASAAVLGTGCGDDVPGDTRLPPSKQDVVELLLSMDDAVRRGDLEGAVDRMVLFPGMSRESALRDLPGVLQREGLSHEAVERLAAKGRFGPLLEVFPTRGKGWAEKAGVDPAYCVALEARPAEVAVYWGGEALRVFRFDDVGKLR